MASLTGGLERRNSTATNKGDGTETRVMEKLEPKVKDFIVSSTIRAWRQKRSEMTRYLKDGDGEEISIPEMKQKPKKPKRKDTQIPQSSGPTTNVADEEIDDSLERAATTATSLDAEQERGNINKTQSKATPNEPSSLGTSSGGGPRRQETMGDTIAQTRFENVSKTSNDPLLERGNTLQSGEDRLKLEELMELCTSLQSRVLALETT
ncbi:hypothetical protein Tco_1057852 [Tanacetum coccineum]|uniref:Uncharacterized protein n=1 Tax=Tanacetum coccineum TaxID=301880 RepID=A0ABQ5H6I9_9ASTR